MDDYGIYLVTTCTKSIVYTRDNMRAFAHGAHVHEDMHEMQLVAGLHAAHSNLTCYFSLNTDAKRLQKTIVTLARVHANIAANRIKSEEHQSHRVCYVTQCVMGFVSGCSTCSLQIEPYHICVHMADMH
jgi:hypothetical protein